MNNILIIYGHIEAIIIDKHRFIHIFDPNLIGLSINKLKYLILLSFLACVKEPADIVPDNYVDFTINIVHYPDLGVSTSAVTISNSDVGENFLGYDNNGIIIYRVDEINFFAYDRTCPDHIEQSTAIELDNSKMFGICPFCKSKYQLWFDGYPTSESQSKYPLKKFRTTFYPNPPESLHVYNY